MEFEIDVILTRAYNTDDRYKFEKNFFTVIKKKFFRSVAFDFYGVKTKLLRKKSFFYS